MNSGSERISDPSSISPLNQSFIHTHNHTNTYDEEDRPDCWPVTGYQLLPAGVMYRRAPLVAPPGTRLHERRCTVWSCYNSHTHHINHTVLYCTSQEALPVRHWGEPGQRYRYKQASKQAMLTGTVPVGSLTTIQTHQQHTTCTSARRPKPRPTQQPQLARCPGRPEPTAPRGRLRRGRLQRTYSEPGVLPVGSPGVFLPHLRP